MYVALKHDENYYAAYFSYLLGVAAYFPIHLFIYSVVRKYACV